jgi:membrane protease YdiL (CAAX protease family)
MAVFYATQIAFALVYVGATMGHLPPAQRASELLKLGANGDVLAVATFLSTPACLLALIAIIKLKRGASLEDTLALHVPPRAVLVRWVLLVIAYIALADGITWLLGKPIVPPFMELAYRSADSKASLWIALVFLAPLFEEMFYRGFVVTGLASSRLGASGAVILSAILWAAIHTQYDVYWMVTILVLGLLLGVARVKTGSVVTPLVMHMVANGVALAEVALR